MPIVIGDCSQLANGMSYDVPGGGKKGSNFVNSSDWTAPFNGRMLVAASHQHGGGKYQTLESRTCGRRLFKAPAYYGAAEPPLQHDPPDPPRARARSATAPSRRGRASRSRRARCCAASAVHDNHNLHVASMGFWSTWFVPGRLRQALRQDARRHRRDQPAEALRPHARTTTSRCRSSPSRAARSAAFAGAPLEIGDDFFRPGRITAKAGETVTWNFGGTRRTA